MTGFANLDHYPAERSYRDESCGFADCEDPVEWVVMCVPSAAMKVCAAHLHDIELSQS